MCWPALSLACAAQRGRSRSSGQTRPKASLAATGQAIDLSFHLIKLALEIVDIARFARTFFGLTAFATALTACKRRKHRKGALEHVHVASDLLFQRGECTDAEGLRQLLAELFLLTGQGFDRDFEVARDQHLHAVAVETDQLAQERDRQKVLSFLVFLLENDLGENRPGDVLAGLGVIDDE